MSKNLPDWFENNAVNEVKFCKEFLDGRLLKCVGDRFYSVDGAVSDDKIAGEIFDKISPYVTSNIARKSENLMKALKYQCRCDGFPAKENEIHLLNGVLKTDGTFTEGKQFCVNRLNIYYRPEFRGGNKYPEKFLKFLSEMLENEDILTLQEYLGYCLIPSTKGQTALFIIGNGGEGKSCIGYVLHEIFQNSLIEGSFQRIETDKFFPYNLQDKLIMLDDDMQMNALTSTGLIKNLITSKVPITVEAKGQQAKQARIYARFICLGNGSPKALYDKSDGFARRLIILTTKPVPPYRIVNPNITDEFIYEKEKIFCWIFEGLQRLISNNFRFTVSEKTKKNISEVMSENCNIIEFLADESYVEFANDFQTSSTEFYGGYVHWCGQNGLTALKQETFIGWLKTNSEKYKIKYDYNVINREGRRVRGFKGIKTCYVSIVS
ncbi:MAG: DUF5906 domain-containing protein [Ruminococcus sp.]|nr:DUF5906 domain-containing protein [Ruminococcus sp.]MCM1380507.1 DUF5906 domain-containing protein [Muribaculaceae bacterium]MCM1478877.1 DUF5906 domain-containing protein [Muribaculaceae bacterium]